MKLKQYITKVVSVNALKSHLIKNADISFQKRDFLGASTTMALTTKLPIT